MHETKTFQNHKIKLNDYDYENDIKNRLFYITATENEVLEEIIYQSMSFSIKTLFENLELEINDLRAILTKFQTIDFIIFKDDWITINKEQKKRIEEKVNTFNPNFKYNLDYLQTLLKKVPIGVQPLWYQLPRTSDNIFNSIIEKYLLTPTLYQRHIEEVKSLNPIYRNMIELVYSNELFRVPLCDLQRVLSIEEHEFEKHIIFLEFSFVLFKTTRNIDNKTNLYLEPLQEYKDFLLMKKTTSIKKNVTEKIIAIRPSEFSFIEDMTLVVKLAKQHELTLDLHEQGNTYCFTEKSYNICIENFKNLTDDEVSKDYLKQVVTKLEALDLIKIEELRIVVGQVACEWMQLELINRSHVTFKHPYNQVILQGLHPKIYSERLIHDIENAVAKKGHLGWIELEEFISQSMISIDKNARLQLKKVGNQYKYLFPKYTPEQENFIRTIIENFLFESSIVELGRFEGKSYFKVTSFGRYIL